MGVIRPASGYPDLSYVNELSAGDSFLYLLPIHAAWLRESCGEQVGGGAHLEGAAGRGHASATATLVLCGLGVEYDDDAEVARRPLPPLAVELPALPKIS